MVPAPCVTKDPRLIEFMRLWSLRSRSISRSEPHSSELFRQRVAKYPGPSYAGDVVTSRCYNTVAMDDKDSYPQVLRDFEALVSAATAVSQGAASRALETS